MDIVCPKCRSDNASKLSLIYKQSVVNVERKGRSSGFSFGGKGLRFNVGTTNERGTNTALLASSVAPPQQPSHIHGIGRILAMWFIGAFICALFLSSMPQWLIGVLTLSFYIGLGVHIFWQIRDNWRYRLIYPQLYQKWDNSFMCQRCETIFELIRRA